MARRQNLARQLGFDLDGGVEAAVTDRLGQRAELVRAVSERLWQALCDVDGTALYEDVELPLVRVLAKMEVAGIGVDGDRLREINAELTNEARRLETEIQDYAGEAFNVNSTAQLRIVLYEKLQLTPQRKTKTGFSTDAATLEKFAASIRSSRRCFATERLKSCVATYGEGLIAEVAVDGRIHASFNQTVARTGRLSSDRPNLQNIPVRSDEGRRFREAFVPADGCGLIVADYNQSHSVSLRI